MRSRDRAFTYGEMSELSCQCLQCRHSVFPSPGERQLNKPSARRGQTLADFRQKYPPVAGIFINGGELLLRGEACGGFIPVDHVPERLDVVRTFVLIFQVVSVFHTSRPIIGKPEAPATASPISGLSWLAVDTTASLPSFSTSQAQPEPKRVAAAFSNSSWNFSTLPKSRSMAAFRSPPSVVPVFRFSRRSCGWRGRRRCCA